MILTTANAVRPAIVTGFPEPEGTEHFLLSSLPAPAAFQHLLSTKSAANHMRYRSG
jgi:hypothetical protein